MILGLRGWGIGIAVAATMVACNVGPEGQPSFTQHCDELQGDATCSSTYNNRPYCSTCVTVNQGCVNVPPALICQPDSGTGGPAETGESTGEGSSSGTTSDGTTVALDDTSGSTGEPPCAQEGELDPGCMELDPKRPYCADAVCVGCEAAGGDPFCGDLDALAPACDGAGGSCVPCFAIDDSAACQGGTPVCGPLGGCVPCETHEQCPGSACHLWDGDPLQGSCFALEDVIYIDNTAPCPGLGTADEPACSLQATAATLVPGDHKVLWVRGGMPYAERAAIAGELTVAIIGEDSPVIAGAPGQQAATLLLEDGIIAYVSGVRINGNPLTHGIMCNSGTVLVERSEVRNNAGWGMFDFEPCTLDVRNTVISSNEDGGVRLAGGDLTIVNTAVGINGIGGNSTGVRVIDGNVDILYSTIVGNNGTGADSLECTGATGTLRNSLLSGVDSFSVALDCFPLAMDNNALDSANFAGGSNEAVGTYQAIYFNGPAQGDFTISAPPLTPYGGIALWQDGDPPLDADGTPRPIGGELGFPGYDEP